MQLDDLAYPVLVVDDEKGNLDTFRFNFRRTFQLLTASSGREGLEVLREHPVAVVIADQRMPGMTGLEFLREARDVRPNAVGIILTAYADVEVLLGAINSGVVYRYVQKPWDRDELTVVIRQALERYHLVAENERLLTRLEELNRYLQRELEAELHVGRLVGSSVALRAVLEQVRQVAPTSSTVLLRGESGTGKELIAHAIHHNSPRRDKPFVRVNCAALAPGVLESELFGHERGSFTGAMARRLGRFELAHAGTLFLDEVGDLPIEVQIKLLRVIQEGEFERVGGSRTIKVDVRLISATSAPLERLLDEGRFREDLYYRLNVFPLHVPPLRDRKEDIPELVQHFIARHRQRVGKAITGIEPDALARLLVHDWPGNVRELENLVERALILAPGERITAESLAFQGRPQKAPPPFGPPVDEPRGTLDATLEALEKRQIEDALRRLGGSKSEVARELGINRTTLYYRLKKHGLD
jgi:DNA-binding NtrC family response regulator